MCRARAALTVVIFLSLLALPLFAPNTSNAEGAVSPWVDSTDLELDKIFDLSASEPLPYSINYNRDCDWRKVVTRPRKVFIHSPFEQKELSHSACVVDTGYGTYSSTGYLQRPGTGVAGQIYGSGSVSLIPVPHSSVGIRLGYAGRDGVYLNMASDFNEGLETKATIPLTGQIEHNTSLAMPPLKGPDGKSMQVKADTMSFSANGQWMVVDTTYLRTIRVNLETFETMSLGEQFNYFSGWDPSLKTAISADGRFVAIGSRSPSYFRIYDLSSCIPPTAPKTTSTCRYRDLMPFLQQKLSGFIGPSIVRFADNNTLRFFGSYKDSNNATQTGQFDLRIPGTKPPVFDYLALGDSFISGEGAYQYRAYTDTRDSHCHLSQRSYPYLLAKDLNLYKAESVACSGAIIDDVSSTSEEYMGQNKDKKPYRDRDNVNQILNDFSVGYIAQYRFTRHYQPNTITLSAGGNDIGFGQIISRCLEPDTCYNTYEDRLELALLIYSQFNHLTNMYTRLIKEGNPKAKIYVIGYPQIIKPGGRCDSNTPLNANETQFAWDLTSYLNSVIKKAAEYAGVYYVDVEDAFEGHRLCEGKWSWETAVNGITAGRDKIDLPLLHGPIGNESFHPNAFGHTLLAEKIREQTNGLSAEMPHPNSSAQPPNAYDNPPLLNAPKTGRGLNITNFDNITDNNVIHRAVWWQGVVDGSELAFVPGSVVHVLLKSDPVDLGTATVDTNGSIPLNFFIPESVPSGFHTLHLYGTNVAGEAVDIQKTVFVAGNGYDYDEDGINNDKDSCPTIPNIGEDIDNDNIDDACDGFIDQAPQQTVETNEQTDSNQSAEQSDTKDAAWLLPVSTGLAQNSLQNSTLASNSAILNTLPSNQIVTTNNKPPEVAGEAAAISSASTNTKPRPNNTLFHQSTEQQTISSYWPIISGISVVSLISLWAYRRNKSS